MMRAAALAASFLSTVVLGATAKISYPPVPPGLGAPLPARDAAAVPAELVPYVHENFYAPLSAWLSPDGDRKLTDALRARLNDYRATKVALQTELRAKIDLLRETDAASRLAGLEEFAREQTPRIVVIEEEAEALRRDLVGGGAKAISVPAAANEAEALRATAFFQEGLSSDQRRLLREVVAEIEMTGTSSGGEWFFFSPADARIRPLTDQSAQCLAKGRVYQEEKKALKAELRAAVAGSVSAASWSDLAIAQAPRFARLVSLAEEIRRGMAVRNDPTRRPELPPLPAALEARIVAYRREKLDLQKALLARVDEVTKNQPAPSGTKRRLPAADASTARQQERVREAIAAYTRENAARYTALERNRDYIRGELSRLANTAGTSANAPSADALLKKFSEAMQQIEVWRNYRDYQIAVLQPGLSPEQRRLLFDAALENIALQAADPARSP